MRIDREVDDRPLAPSDPMVLLRLRVGPVERREVGIEPVGVGGDLEHPLPQRQAYDRMPSALALAVVYSFVGEHRAERRAPVDRDVGLVGEPFVVELEKDPLRPLYVA